MMKSNIVLTTFLLALIMITSCKKEKVVSPETPQMGTVTEVMQSPKFAELQGGAVSENKQYIYLNPIEGSKQISTDGGATWKTTTISALYYNPSAISNTGFLLIQADRNKFQLWNLNTQSEVLLGISNYYAQFYIGFEDDIYCYSGSNSQSLPSPLLHRKLSATNWDTIHSASNILGEVVGVAQGGLAFFNTNKLELSIVNANTKAVSTKSVNVDLNLITGPKGNKPMRMVYSGKDYLAFGYTKGCARVNLNTNSAEYTSFPGDMNNHYENPYIMTVSNTGEVFTMLNSYTQPLAAHTWSQNGNFQKSGASIPNPCAFNTSLFSGLAGIKINDATNSVKLSGYQSTSAIIKSAAISNNNTYSLIATNKTATGVFLYTSNLGAQEGILRTEINGLYSYIYADNNTVIIIGNDSGLISADAGKTFTKTTGSRINLIRNVNGTYYGMQNSPYTYFLGGTGFSIPKHLFQLSSSANGKDWTVVSGPVVDQSGSGPQAFTNTGYLSRGYNITPQGNPTYVYDATTDWGKTWTPTNLPHFFNAATESKLYDFNYSGGTIKNTIYNYDFEKIKTIDYTYFNPSLSASVQSPIIDNQSLFYIMSDKILKFSL